MVRLAAVVVLQTCFVLAIIGVRLQEGHSFASVGCSVPRARDHGQRTMRVIGDEDATLRDSCSLSQDILPCFLEFQGSILKPAVSPLVLGPSEETKPHYDSIHGPLGKFLDHAFLSVFRAKLADNAGFDSYRPGYSGICDIASQMNKRYSRVEVQARALRVLVSLFPSWMPPAYKILFSRPFPAFSARMNAWATWVAGTWLMGECEINDVEVLENAENGKTEAFIWKDQGLHVKRCRFLEEAGCASVCVNCCQLPTQVFFSEYMGLPLLIEPNYETFECQFSFGKCPTAETELKAMKTPCLARCTSSGGSRASHKARAPEREYNVEDVQCSWMED